MYRQREQCSGKETLQILSAASMWISCAPYVLCAPCCSCECLQGGVCGLITPKVDYTLCTHYYWTHWSLIGGDWGWWLQIFVTDTWRNPKKWCLRSCLPFVTPLSSQVPALLLCWGRQNLNPLWIIFVFSCWEASDFCPSTLLLLSQVPFMWPLCSLK